ncbi:hypothetical protein BaRGS_00012411 [Batillaria attramentaria]|uniref:Uncharacterized protein n=1 Tax=Batillaria attramentaria TaxID=370345 RepID=A0ABD0LAC8_9CAEN
MWFVRLVHRVMAEQGARDKRLRDPIRMLGKQNPEAADKGKARGGESLAASAGKLQLFTSHHCQRELNATQNWAISFKFTVIVGATGRAEQETLGRAFSVPLAPAIQPRARNSMVSSRARERTTSSARARVSVALSTRTRTVVWPARFR